MSIILSGWFYKTDTTRILSWTVSHYQIYPNLPCAVPLTGRFGQSSSKTKIHPSIFDPHQRAVSESTFLVLNWCLWKHASTHYLGQGNTVLSSVQLPIWGQWIIPKYHTVDQIFFSGFYQSSHHHELQHSSLESMGLLQLPVCECLLDLQKAKEWALPQLLPGNTAAREPDLHTVNYSPPLAFTADPALETSRAQSWGTETFLCKDYCWQHKNSKLETGMEQDIKAPTAQS